MGGFFSPPKPKAPPGPSKAELDAIAFTMAFAARTALTARLTGASGSPPLRIIAAQSESAAVAAGNRSAKVQPQSGSARSGRSRR